MTTTSPPTPPSTTSPTPPSRPCTPIHIRSTTTDRYAPLYQNRESTLCRLAIQICPFLVGPLSADAFLKYFLPPPPVPLPSPFVVGMFKPLIEVLSKRENPCYKIFVSLTHVARRSLHLLLGLIFSFQNDIVSQHLPNLIIHNTSSSQDQALQDKFPLLLKPDCSVYANTEETKKQRATV
jgi:hypothetical protein